MKKIHLRIVTPDRTVVDKPVDMVGAMGTEGAFTILPGHIDFLTALRTEALWYRQDGRTRELSVSGGLVEVKPDHVRVLADRAEYSEKIDLEQVRQSVKRTRDLLTKAKVAGPGKHKHKHHHGHGHGHKHGPDHRQP